MIPKALASLKDGGWLVPNALLVAETRRSRWTTGYELLDDAIMAKRGVCDRRRDYGDDAGMRAS